MNLLRGILDFTNFFFLSVSNFNLPLAPVDQNYIRKIIIFENNWPILNGSEPYFQRWCTKCWVVFANKFYELHSKKLPLSLFRTNNNTNKIIIGLVIYLTVKPSIWDLSRKKETLEHCSAYSTTCNRIIICTIIWLLFLLTSFNLFNDMEKLFINKFDYNDCIQYTEWVLKGLR